jgi:predicted ester cyclase
VSELQSLIEQHYANFSAGGNVEADREIFSPDVVTIAPGGPPLQGIDAFLAFERGFHRGFPDGRGEVKSVVESGNRIAVQGLYSGTNTGPLATPQGEIPPTGRRLELPYGDFFEVEDGKVTRHEIYFDQLVMLMQLGLMPEPASA